MEISGKFHAGLVLDGYRLIRPIGSGGFGTVWLAEGEVTGDFHAVKIVDASVKALEQELAAVRRFRESSRQIRSPHLIAVEHVNAHGSALFYVLPLADGGHALDPMDPDWCPDTLASRIEAKMASGEWFSSCEILEVFLPIARVVAEINNGGVVHRDIKPANILFVGGLPCLADIGLLDDDSQSLSARGTPGHVPPSWYLEASGQPDMWGLATTLYTLLTGNHPDKIGRANFRWPPQGEGSLSQEERKTWNYLHSIILRATEGSPHERYLTIRAFADACTVEGNGEGKAPERHWLFPTQIAVAICTVLIAIAVLFWIGRNTDWLETRSMTNQNLQDKTGAPQQVALPEIDFTGLVEGMDGGLKSIKEIRQKLEKTPGRLENPNAEAQK